MNLKELLAGVACEVVQGRPDVEVKMIHFDSRKVGEGDLFIAQRGVNADGHEYITKAVAAGAVAVVCEEVPGELKELAKRSIMQRFAFIDNAKRFFARA